MAFGRRQREAPDTSLAVTAESSPQSLVAAATRITSQTLANQGWRTYRFGDQSWQQELWRLYDLIGELRFVANWIGSACSRVRIYVANVDRNGRVQEEVDDPKIAALADNLFGGVNAKAEALRLLGINLTVAGDAYVVGTGGKNGMPDQWRILSCSELRRWGDNLWWLGPDGEREKIDVSNSIVYRIWTPHPRYVLRADSPTRAAMPVLHEIERLTRFVFAQIDSRLVSAGLMFLPKEVSFPDADDPRIQLTGAEALTERLMRTAGSSLKGDGTAAGVVPIFAEMPTEALGKIQLLQFTSELSQQAQALRTEALRRFGLAMDIDPSILQGAGDANHWGAWQITEGQVKIHIEPMLTRINDANTEAYLRPALEVLGKDPARFAYAADTAPLTIRPQRLKDTMDMYKEGHVTRQTVLLSGDYKISDLPNDVEDLRRFTRELMLRDPNLFSNPAVRKAAGYTEEVLPADTVIAPRPGSGSPGQPGGAGPPPPPPPPDGIMGHQLPVLPAGSTAQNALPGPPATPAGAPAGIVASASVPSPVTVFVVANAAVLRALEVAGKRLLTSATRGTLTDTPPFALHTKIKVNGVEHGRQILAGAWDHLSVLTDHLDLAVDTTKLQSALQMYCLTLLVQERPHDVYNLGETLSSQGLLDGYP